MNQQNLEKAVRYLQRELNILSRKVEALEVVFRQRYRGEDESKS